MDTDRIPLMLWLVASQMGVHALSWLLAARLLPEARRTLYLWSAFMLCLAIGLSLAGLRSEAQRSWWTYNAVNAITIAGFVALRVGVERFMGVATPAPWQLGPGLLGLLVLVALPASPHWAPLRVFTAYAVQSWLMGAMLLAIARPLKREFGGGTMLGLLLPGSLIVLIMAALALRQLMNWGQAGEMHQATGVNLGLMYVYLLGSAAFNIGFLTIVLQRLTLRLREQAVRDPLTGLLNRRAMDAALERQWQRQRRTGRPLAVLMLDIDHFKRINDERGHAAGDAVLRQLAAEMLAERRTDDAVARVGGEEFLVLLPEVGADEALPLAERLRERVAKALPGVTVSIGVAEPGGPSDDPDALLRRADEALYRAKAAGRNRVERG